MRLAAFVLAGVLAAPAAAQQPRKADPPDEPVLNWEVTLGGAGALGANSSDIEGAMREAGYGQSLQSSGDFLSASFFPSIRWRIGDRFAVGVSAASTKIGSTTGTAPPTTVPVQRSSADIALILFWRPIAGVRAGAGPAWYRLRATPAGGGDLTVSQMGWLAEAGLAFPDAGRVFADLGVQYRGTGRADFGTYTPPPSGGRAAAPIPLNRVGCDHWAFVAGVGFRF